MGPNKNVIVIRRDDGLYLYDYEGGIHGEPTCNGEVMIPDGLELLGPGLFRNLKERNSTILNVNNFNQKLCNIYNTFYKKDKALNINVGDLVANGNNYIKLVDIYEKIMSARLGYIVRVRQCDYDCNEGEKCIKLTKEAKIDGANYEV